MADQILKSTVAASGTTLTTSSNWASNFPMLAVYEPKMLVPVGTGAYVNPSALPVLAAQPGKLTGHFLFDFYYRVWVIPNVFTVQNPQYNTDIPFSIWNAYPQPPTNALQSITVTNGTGLTLDLAAPSTFKSIELKTVNIQITETAGFMVDASFGFNFAAGADTLYFKAAIADYVQMVPQVPIKETWSWLTTELTAWDGTEQRIALRDVPRASLTIKVMLRNDKDFQRQYDRLFKSMGRLLVIPYYQYTTVLTQDVNSGGSILYFDPSKTDVREGEFAIVYDSVGEQGFLVKLGTANVAGDGFAVTNPITFDAKKSWWVAPAYTSRLMDGAALSMKSVTGELNLTCPVVITRMLFKRPGSTAAWPTLNGYPILEQRPNADSSVADSFVRNAEVIDYETGVQVEKATWLHPFVGGKRTYFVPRTSDPAQMDFWRDFLATARGKQNPFLTSTFRADLTAYAVPTAGSLLLQVTSLDYADRYHQYQSGRRIAIELTDGRIFYRDVLQATNHPTYCELQLSSAFGAAPADLDIAKISFLNLVRLGTDIVTLTHQHTYSLLELQLRTIDG